jgi:hypothetical protein
VPPIHVLRWLLDQGRSLADEFEYFGSARFIAAANDNAAARITSKEVYEPVERQQTWCHFPVPRYSCIRSNRLVGELSQNRASD